MTASSTAAPKLIAAATSFVAVTSPAPKLNNLYDKISVKINNPATANALINKAKERDNIDIMTSVASQEVKATAGKVSSLIYQDRTTGENKELPLSAIFVQIGLVPNSEVVKDLVQVTKFGEIEINEKCQTNKPGIFACGDVTTVPFKQINIALGEGSKAALSAFEYLMLQ